MSLKLASLNSGSNGNCYYIGNDKEAVLIDAGISCRETEKRMKRSGLEIAKVKAVFVSHEHTDHISGIDTLANKYNIPVYITNATLRNSRLKLHDCCVYSFIPNSPVNIGQLTIHPFQKYHDACDPHSFTVSGNGVTIGIFTDIGKCCEQVVYHFKKCHAAILEANYDATMLAKGSYPYHLKRRITGGNGHLSNDEALQLFVKHKAPYLSHLVLSHLSKNNNCPKLVEQLFNEQAGTTQIIVASRYEESRVYDVTSLNKYRNPVEFKINSASQLTLF